MVTLFTIVIVAFLASVLTLYSGFGLGTILMPVAAIFFPVKFAIALTAVVHLLNNVFKFLLLWRTVNWRVVLRFGLPAIFAAVPGAILLNVVSTLPALYLYSIGSYQAIIKPVKIMAGLLVLIVATIQSRSLLKSIKFNYVLPIGGILSGFFGGLSGHQGAFRSAFLIQSSLGKEAFVGTSSAIAILIDATRLIAYSYDIELLFDRVSPRLIFNSIAATFFGVLVGKLLLQKVSFDLMQKMVTVLLYVLALLLIAGII